MFLHLLIISLRKTNKFYIFALENTMKQYMMKYDLDFRAEFHWATKAALPCTKHLLSTHRLFLRVTLCSSQ